MVFSVNQNHERTKKKGHTVKSKEKGPKKWNGKHKIDLSILEALLHAETIKIKDKKKTELKERKKKARKPKEVIPTLLTTPFLTAGNPVVLDDWNKEEPKP